MGKMGFHFISVWNFHPSTYGNLAELVFVWRTLLLEENKPENMALDYSKNPWSQPVMILRMSCTYAWHIYDTSKIVSITLSEAVLNVSWCVIVNYLSCFLRSKHWPLIQIREGGWENTLAEMRIKLIVYKSKWKEIPQRCTYHSLTASTDLVQNVKETRFCLCPTISSLSNFYNPVHRIYLEA